LGVGNGTRLAINCLNSLINDHIAYALGTLAVGLFASLAVNSAGANGAFFGNTRQFFIQAGAVAFVGLYSFGLTYIVLKALGATIGIRVHSDQETEGLDISQHGEAGYTL
jgi:ammonium transporter, Amt family